MKKAIILLSILLLISCGSRKIKKETENEVTDKKKDITISELKKKVSELEDYKLQVESQTKQSENNTAIKTNVKENKETDEIISVVEADDKSKPAYYNGKPLDNAKVTETRRKSKENKIDNSLYMKQIKTLESSLKEIKEDLKISETENKQYQQTIKELEKVAKSKVVKQTKKSEPYVLYIFLLILFILALMFIYKKFIEPIEKNS